MIYFEHYASEKDVNKLNNMTRFALLLKNKNPKGYDKIIKKARRLYKKLKANEQKKIKTEYRKELI